MVIDKNHYRFLLLIEVTTSFLYRFLSIDIGNRYSSTIGTDFYRLAVYRLTTSGCGYCFSFVEYIVVKKELNL